MTSRSHSALNRGRDCAEGWRETQDSQERLVEIGVAGRRLMPAI